MPKGRSVAYAVWRACERMGIRPPYIAGEWNENTSWSQALLLAYSMIRDYEDGQSGIL